MIPELEDYIARHSDPHPTHLQALERDSNLRLVNGRMVSGHIQGRLLRMLTIMIAPKRALELGTFSGYSALCIAEGLPENAELHSIEVNDELESFITRHWQNRPEAKKIHLHIGDAERTMQSFPDLSFQLIFIDADKRRYPQYYAEAKRLLAPGGYIIADNTLWDGHVIDPHRNDPQTAGIKRFNDLIAADADFEKVIIPLRDGLTLIRKKPNVATGVIN